MILAPLRGVTVRCFREVFAEVIREAGFTEAVSPFVAANPGYDPLRDRELAGPVEPGLTPQFIGRDPEALGEALRRVKAAGYATADLNCGCPYPMVRAKGRGAGILRTPDVLERMLAVGCEVMGPGRFSVKARLGIERKDELLALMPVINRYPLRRLTVHARTARQMYGGACDFEAVARIEAVASAPVVRNGDLALGAEGMVGRAFIRALGERDDIGELLRRYIAASRAELAGDAPVLGRMKELVAYWKLLPAWHRRWNIVKLCRTVEELESVI